MELIAHPIVDLVERLRREARAAGGDFVATLGNHELMNAQLDFRYVTKGAATTFEEFAGEVTVAKVNIEESPSTPTRYGVRGIPTLMLFKDGQMASMKVGAMPKQKILEWLNDAGVQQADAGAARA